MGPRGAFSQLLVVGALLLLVAIGVGMGMGNRVLGQVAGREPVVPTAVPISTASSGNAGSWNAWKRTSVMSVATDPGFPDPRVTAEPEVKATPKHTPTPKPSPTPTAARENGNYTSPPLPIPLVSHTPEGPESEASRGPNPPPISRATASGQPGRIPTLPPVVGPSLSP